MIIPMVVCVVVGEEIPLVGGLKATIVGVFEGKVLARCENSNVLVHVVGVKLTD